MNTETVSIEQMNEAMRLFMNIIEYKDAKFPQFFEAQYLDNNGKAWGLVKDGLEFHLSWDWIIPVVKRIRSIMQKDIKSRKEHSCTTGDLIEVDIQCSLWECDIEKVHHHVHQFIYWFKHEKQKQ